MKSNLTRFAVLALALLVPAAAQAEIQTVLLPSEGSPMVAVRLMFEVGSIHDPAGKEGLAALTGLMIGEAGTAKRSYAELVDALYPMAAEINVNTDREVTTITGEIHRDNLEAYTALLTEALLEPGFAEADFARNKEQLNAYLTNTLRGTNDELLGLEMMQQVLFPGHPYEHSPAGTVQGLAAITLDDVKEFHGKHFTQANLSLGLAGGYSDADLEAFTDAASGLPTGKRSVVELGKPASVEGRNFTLVEKVTDSVGIHFGYPLELTWADDDYYALMVANSFLGEHRTFNGRLMQQLRGKRGLNYGDYSYIEYYDSPPFTSNPTPNVPRRQQYFSVWIRPVVPTTAHFAIRNALYEVDRLVERGMTEEEFELTRNFVVNYSKLWAQTLARRLGFLMDSGFYGTSYYIDRIDERLKQLTVEDVNAAIKKYIRADDYQAVFVTANAAAVKEYLESETPSPMEYNAEPEPEVVEADKVIHKLEIGPTKIGIVKVEDLFEGK